MSHAEMVEWAAEFRRDPWDEERADLRSGIIAAVVAGSAGVKRPKPSDYMPKYEPAEKVSQTAEQMAAVFNAFRR